MRSLLLSLALLAAAPALAQEAAVAPSAPEPEVRLNGSQVLLPGVGPGWRLVDKAAGKEKQIILPAFHPELSAPVVLGNRMAYVGRTQNQGRLQLGCITYDLAKGRVLNRQVSPLFTREGQSVSQPELSDTESFVTCHLAGERCSGKNLEHCTPATDSITLDFEAGSLAHKDLKSAKAGRHGHGKVAKGSRSAKAGKTTRGSKIHGHSAKGSSKASGKTSGKATGKAHRGGKTAAPSHSRKARHP